VAKGLAEILGPVAAEATAAEKQLSNLVDLGPILLGSDDLGLMQVMASLEAETARLLALTPQALTAPRPPLTCVLEPEKAAAAVRSSLQSPIVAPPKPPPPAPTFRYLHTDAQALAC
jgi:hypothetical protein